MRFASASAPATSRTGERYMPKYRPGYADDMSRSIASGIVTHSACATRSIASTCAASSTISVIERPRLSWAATARRSSGSTVGYATTTSSNPPSASHAASAAA